MSGASDEIPQRELRNDVARILRRVAAGSSVRVTVRGKPVAELVPIRPGRRFATRADVKRILAGSPLDPGFASDVDAALAGRIDEL
jgi:prevent-host-death family protein